MYLIDQHTKKIMEECKVRARAAGLHFDKETLEYIVTNRDMIELSPKVMIPTLYDYWVSDVEVLKDQGKYKLYPSNPYETVINSRPAISFYNDNNPDWMNIMIFYHVLGHIDFFQNNILFQDTWNDDFVGMALADKRLIQNLRGKYGRWVDYVIEFSRSIDNITGYFKTLAKNNYPYQLEPEDKVKFYFNTFLQDILRLPQHEIFKEIDRYNKLIEQNSKVGESMFFSEVRERYPEFQAKYENGNIDYKPSIDLLEFIRDHSPFLRKEENHWMKTVMTVVRNTSLYFGPQIRTKIVNEGWASYWHDSLFRGDNRIKGHEVGYAQLNAGVTSISRVGLNPYAIGLRLIQHIEKLANKGKLNFDFQKYQNQEDREKFDKNTGKGQDAIFEIRKNFSDFMLINTFVSQDFVDEYDLFVVGKRYNEKRNTIEYYIKSRKAEDYKKMLLDSLYHPPVVDVNIEKTNDSNLYINHLFEGKQLIKDFVPDVLIGLEYLWGGSVQLETTEIHVKKPKNDEESIGFSYRDVLYTIKDKKVSKTNI